MQTYLSTDWLEVRGGSSTMVKVVLTDESEAYLISVTNVNGKPEAELFKMKGKFGYNSGEEFFNEVINCWSDADKLPLEIAVEMGLIVNSELDEIISKIQ